MYIFEYHDQTYYINVEKIASMKVGAYMGWQSSSPFADLHNQWTLTIKYENANDTFMFDTQEMARTLANEIRNMYSAMFDARIGK